MSHCCFGKQKLAETTPLRIIVISWHHFFFFNFPFVFLFNFGRACLVFHKGVAGTHKVLLLSLRVF